jgi:hypothetical protein
MVHLLSFVYESMSLMLFRALSSLCSCTFLYYPHGFQYETDEGSKALDALDRDCRSETIHLSIL